MVNSSNLDIFTIVENMPAFPKSVQHVIQLTSDANSSAKEIIKVIENDPVMTVKVLKIVNSPYYGLPQKINSVSKAVVFTGLNTIKNVALSIAAIGVLKPHNSAEYDFQDFLLHSVSTGIIAEKIAILKSQPTQDHSDYFVAGLLHDFGKLIFAQFLPKEFGEALTVSHEKMVPLHSAEQQCIGTDHAQVGKLLAERWDFSESLIRAIGNHHVEEDYDGLSDAVIAANEISKTLHLGSSGNEIVKPFSKSLQSRLGYSLEELISEIGDPDLIKSEALTVILS